MNEASIRVLLISETEHGCSNLRGRMELRNYRCWFASSFDEAAEHFRKQSFHLVISTIRFHQCDGLLARLAGLPSTVFQCFLVEDGCWWLPVAREGQECLGAPALRAEEFLGEIDRTVAELRAERHPLAHAAP
jgi:hypothetical protein